jgi:ribosomal protein S18 acetylase RimI-like enzyme
MSPASLRPLRESDVVAALALLRDAVRAPSYATLLGSVTEAAALTPSTEHSGMVAEMDGQPVAIAVYGEFAGATGAGRLHLVAVDRDHRRRGLGTLLIDRVAAELRARRSRFILAELPDEHPALDDYFAFLHASGFTEESRIPHFYREEVGLVFLRREVVERKQKAGSRKQ